jgi:hypothetical protein
MMYMMMTLFIISTVIIGVSATITLQDANAASNDHNNSCRQHHDTSDNSKKCSQNDTPLILPFP